MKTYKPSIKSAAVLAGAALVPTAAVFMSGLFSNAIAGSDSQNMAVSATVNANCKFQGAGATLAFGTYDPVYANVTADLDSSTSFSVKCTKGASVTLKMGLGANSVSGQRRLKAGADNYLNYNLYSDTGRTTVWNDTTSTVAYNPINSSAKSFDVFGRIPSGQEADVGVGSYSDTVSITAEF